ncbi:hypothetical protein BG003_010964 [Podila horticola]|nr:hypothetical protein BG003_010964 [Podila horticola]
MEIDQDNINTICAAFDNHPPGHIHRCTNEVKPPQPVCRVHINHCLHKYHRSMTSHPDLWHDQPIKDIKVLIEGVQQTVFTTNDLQELLSVIAGQGLLSMPMKTLILTRMMQYFAQLSTRLPIQQEANITFKMLPVGLAKAALRLMRNCTKTGFIHATHFELESNAVLSLVTYDYIFRAALAQPFPPLMFKIEASTTKRDEYITSLKNTVRVKSMTQFQDSLPRKKPDRPMAFVELAADIIRLLLAPHQRDLLLDPHQEEFALDTFAIRSVPGSKPHEQIRHTISIWL